MTIREENRDLFTVPQGYYLAHCISGDYALGAGIAKQFVEVYDMKSKLHKFFPIETGEKYANVGKALLVDNVFNLVTKTKHFLKPTYDSVYETLLDMLYQIEEKGITKLAIPHIGCGLDRLGWDQVKVILERTFEDYDIDILVCVV